MNIVPAKNVAFDDVTTLAMGAAFDRACKSLGDIGRGIAGREMIAKCIIEFAKNGERDPVQLHEKALKSLRIEDMLIKRNRSPLRRPYAAACCAAWHAGRPKPYLSIFADIAGRLASMSGDDFLGRGSAVRAAAARDQMPTPSTTADRAGLEVMGFILGGVTAVVIAIAVLVVRSEVNVKAAMANPPTHVVPVSLTPKR